MNRTLFAADCLDILNDSAALPDASIDLIYLDPPFNSNSKYNLPFKGKRKEHKPVEAFVDIWKWSDQDAETLDDLQRDPRTRSLATIIKFAQDIEQMSGGGQEGYEFSLLPAEYGAAPAGYAARFEAYKLDLSAL